MADIFSAAGKSSGGAATVVCRCQLPLPWCYLTKRLAKTQIFEMFFVFPSFALSNRRAKGF
jgi:hypothetical protein